MTITAQHLDLISRIYDVVLDSDDWPDILDRLAHAVDAKYANLVMSDFTHPEVNVGAASFDETIQATYRDVYAESERGMAVNMLTYPVHQFLTDEDLCTWGVPWEQLPSVPWLKRDVGVFRRITTRLNDNGAWLDGLTFLFAKDRGQMTAPERETARIFLPHVAKAVELTRPFQLLKIRFQGVLSALNHLNIGLLLLSESGAVVVKNAEAERILDLKDGLSIDSGGRLRARAGSGDEVLGAAVAAAVSTAKAEGNDSGTLLAVARPSLSDSFLLSVAPLIDSTLVWAANAAPAAAQANIGAVRSVTVYAYGTPEGDDRGALFARTRVFAQERIETVRTGGLNIEFVDGTVLRLGSSSDLILDEFVYDDDTETGQLVANVGKGAFRFITGKLGGPGFKVRTPTAVIGVRGTDFVVLVAEDGATQVAVLDGEVEIAAFDATDAIVVPAGQSAGISAGGGAVALVPFQRITDSALGVGAAAADGAGDADVYESDVGVESDY